MSTDRTNIRKKAKFGRKASETVAAEVVETAMAAPVDTGKIDQELLDIKNEIQKKFMDEIDVGKAATLDRKELSTQAKSIILEILHETKILLNSEETLELVDILLDEMLGLGPLEPLLADDSINDIMVNGDEAVYIERAGLIELTDVRFKDNQHVMNIAHRIATRAGRRIDETSPMLDARLADGSRVNIIIPPLALKGPTISIRKFGKRAITLPRMVEQQNLTEQMALLLKIAAKARLNILISGGTGSGKTTLLNAISQMINPKERIVTIEDAAELQLQQPHVITLESKPANLEGNGKISIQDLLINALRMRPDRIIVGEVRSAEVIDMLQAMNTGHDGSLGTIHANNPREAMTRIENMVSMSSVAIPSLALKTQISSALDLIVQVSRMRDGVRRIVSITEVLGMEGEVITTQELFKYKIDGEDDNGKLIGHFEAAELRPHFWDRASDHGLEVEMKNLYAYN